MTRIRIGLFITMIIGAMYAACGLLTSLQEFGIGVAVVATAAIAHGFINYAHDSEIAVERDRVWARRDR